MTVPQRDINVAQAFVPVLTFFSNVSGPLDWLFVATMSAKTRDTGLLVLVVLLVCLAILTLLPFSTSKPNDLGYASTCPFAPWSTVALLMAAGLIWAIRSYLQTRAD